MAKKCYPHKNEEPCRECASAVMATIVPPDMMTAMARNHRVQDRYDQLMRIGKHGHYETMFQVIKEERDRSLEDAAQAVHDSLTDARWNVDAWQMHNHVLKTIRNLKSET